MSRETDNLKPRTLVDVFFRVVDRNLDPVMLYEQGGQWKTISLRRPLSAGGGNQPGPA